MKYRSVLSLVTLLCLSINTATARERVSNRGVDLILMGSDLGHNASERALVDQDAPSRHDTFRVYDLSRQPVTRDTHSLLAGAEGTLEGRQLADGGRNRIAATSSIAVPFWMLSGYAPPRNAPHACSPTPYQASGLLRPEAEARRAAFYSTMSAVACEHGIPTGLFDAVIIQESRYNPMAMSSRKAMGLAQLMPGTALQLGINSRDPVQNLRGGARYLRQQIDRFGHVHLALAAYNAGPGRVRGGMVPQIAETRGYVAAILNNWSRLARSSSGVVPKLPHAEPRGRTVSVYAF